MVPKPPAPTMAETNASILKSPTMEFGTGDVSPGTFNSPQPTPTATGNALDRGFKSAVTFAKDNPYLATTAAMGLNYLMQPEPPEKKKYERRDMSGFQRSEPSTSEYTPIYAPASYAAEGGLMSYAVGGPVEQMSAMNAVGANTGYPMANLQTPMYSNPMMQRPMPTNVIAPSADAGVDPYTGEPRFAEGGNVPAVEKLEERNRKLLGIKTPQEVEEDFERGQDVMRREGFGIVTDSDVDTRRKSPAAAAITQLKKIGKRVGTPVSDMPKSAVVDTDVFHAAQGGIMRDAERYAKGGETQYGVASNPNHVNPENYTRSELAGGRNPNLKAKPSRAPFPEYTASTAPQTMYVPKSYQDNPTYQMPVQQSDTNDFYDYMDQQLASYDNYGYAAGGGVMSGSHLGDYSDGGRLLKGPGDGVSDSIPASIGSRQPARLADGEFVVPARIVSEIGNGSTEAGARKLYAMMERVQKSRKKSIGKNKVAVNSKADKHLPA